MITVKTNDQALARMLFLEARRQGFSETGEPSVLFVDLDDFPPPTASDPALLPIGITADPDALPPTAKRAVFALLTRPFSVTEFADILYRYRGNGENEGLRIQGERLWLGGREILLSPAEQKLFRLLYDNRRRVVSEAECNEALGENAAHSNTAAVYLYRLRKKLCADGVQRIVTLRKKGYQWKKVR